MPFTLVVARDPEPVHRTLSVKIADVKGKEFPAEDDAFAATLGFGSWAEVDAEIRRGLEAERSRETARAQREELIDKLLLATPMGAPPSTGGAPIGPARGWAASSVRGSSSGAPFRRQGRHLQDRDFPVTYQ